MPAEGLCLRVTHTGLARVSLPLNDIDDGVGRSTGDDVFRRAGPSYVPENQSIELVYTSDVAKSFEVGTIRGYINSGHLTATFVIGATLAPFFGIIAVRDEGILLTSAATSLDFVGAGVTATNVGGLVTVTIPGGGGGGTHPGLPAPGLVWSVSGHTGTPSSVAAFTAGGAATTLSTTVSGDVSGTFPGPLTVTDFSLAGQAQGDVIYFDGANWVVLPAGTSGEVLTTQGAGSNPIWSSAGSAQLTWGADAVSSTTTTRYLYPGNSDQLAQTIPIQIRMVRAGTLRNMRTRHNSPGGNGNAIVYTFRVNSVASILTTSLASTGSDASDLVNTVAVAADDLVDVEITKAASVGSSPNDVIVTVEFV